MDAAIAEALRTPPPGRMVKALAPVVPGVRTTAGQISAYGARWSDLADEALRGTGPLVVALGDSLGQGIGASSFEVVWLRHLVAEPIVNLSRSGARIDDVIDVQLPALLAIDQPVTAVTLTVGSNDLSRGARPAVVVRRFEALLDRLPPTAIVATLPAGASLAARKVNRRLRAAVAERELRLADVDRHLRTWRGHSAGDRFHPNDRGYDAWLTAFTDAMDVS